MSNSLINAKQNPNISGKGDNEYSLRITTENMSIMKLHNQYIMISFYEKEIEKVFNISYSRRIHNGCVQYPIKFNNVPSTTSQSHNHHHYVL